MAGDEANPGPAQARIGDKVVADWWTLFQSPALDALLREAVKGNKTLAQARAHLAASRDAVGAETGQLTGDLTAGAKRERVNLNAFSGGEFSSFSLPGGITFPTNPEFNLYSVGAGVSYNIDLFGGVRRKRESLQATAEAQARELDAAYLTLTGQVVQQALTIADANVQIRDLQDVVSSDQAVLDMLRRALAAGGAKAIDIKAAESALAQDSAAVPLQRQRLAEARHQLALLMGKSPSEWAAPDFDDHSGVLPEALPLAIPSELVRNRPDILEAEAQLHAATAQIGVATADLYPKITLSAALSQDALTPRQIFSATATSWNLGPGLTLPLFNRGELRAKKREAEDNARAALAAYEQTVLAAFVQVDDVLQGLVHDNQTYAEQTKALDAAAARLEMMRRGFTAGGVSGEQVVEAERDWRRTRIALAQQGLGRVRDIALLLIATANVPPGVAEGTKTE